MSTNGPCCTEPRQVYRTTLHQGVAANRHGSGSLEVIAKVHEAGGKPLVGFRIGNSADCVLDFIDPEDARAYARLFQAAADAADPPKCHSCAAHLPHLRHHDPAHPVYEPQEGP